MLRLPRVTVATLDVLRVLEASEGPVWGLQVIQATSRGPGTVYPILERLEQWGWLESEWESDSGRRGPRRRLYRLSADGSASVGHALSEKVRPRRPSAVGKAAEA